MYGPEKLSAYSAQLTARGPIFARVAVRYTYDNGNTLDLTEQVTAGDNTVRWEMKSLVDRPGLPGDTGRQIDNPDLVPPVTAVKHRSVTPGGIEREAEGEVTKFDLPARRPDGPLVVQQGRSVGLQARKNRRSRPVDRRQHQGEKENGGEEPG